MASSYSTNLGLELPATGEKSGVWGDIVNTNLGTLLEEAISGMYSVSITDGADTTITMPNGATGVARNMYLVLLGTLTATRNLIVPAKKKLYFVYNACTYPVTVKCSGETGITIPSNKRMVLVCNGTDIFNAIDYMAGNISGNAATVTNGLYSDQSYPDPSWLTLLSASKLTGTIASDRLPIVPTTKGGTGADSVGTARTNLGVPSTTGSGASGTWSINISGNAATATTATTATTAANVTGTSSSFTVNLRSAYTGGTLYASGTAYWFKAGKVVTLTLPALKNSSLSGQLYAFLQGLPTDIRSACALQQSVALPVQDASSTGMAFAEIFGGSVDYARVYTAGGTYGFDGTDPGIWEGATITYRVAD